MDRTQKQEVVSQLKETLEASSTVVVAHYRGMTVDEMTEFRAKAREEGANVQVAKNTLAKIASSETSFSGLSDFFTGPTALTLSEDAVAAAKAVVDYANENEKLVIVGGAVDGKLLDEAGVKALAKTPSLDESRGKIVGLLTASAGNLASVLQAPGGQVARVLGARAAQGE